MCLLQSHVPHLSCRLRPVRDSDPTCQDQMTYILEPGSPRRVRKPREGKLQRLNTARKQGMRLRIGMKIVPRVARAWQNEFKPKDA